MKTILITGSSTGIGRASAEHFAQKDFWVWAGVRSQQSADEIKALNVPNLQPVVLDVTNSNSISEAFQYISKHSKNFSGLVNNAGLAVAGPIEGLSMQDWHRQFDTNVFGLVEVTRTFLPLLRAQRGRIVNISSIAGRVASPFLGPYSASKFAVEAISDSLRREVKSLGVKVALIEPGPVNTPIWQKSRKGAEVSKAELSQTVNEIYGEQIKKFEERVREAEENAVEVQEVVKKIEHALTAKNPRTRYPVGPGISWMSRLAGILPDPVLDQMISTKFR